MCLWDASPLNASLLPPFHQASMTIHQDPFYTPGWRERGTVRIKFFAQEHNTLTWPGLEFRPLAPESSALTIRKMVDFELDEDEEKGVFWSHHK